MFEGLAAWARDAFITAAVQTVLTQKSYLIVPGTSAPRERGVGFVASSSNDYEDQSS